MASRGDNLRNAAKHYAADDLVAVGLPYDASDSVAVNILRCAVDYCEDSGNNVAELLETLDDRNAVAVVSHS